MTEAALLSAFAQRANIHSQADFDAIARALRRGKYLPRKTVRQRPLLPGRVRLERFCLHRTGRRYHQQTTG
uniref:Uncharacterized protein n=1 Tax=termite gut metagenome TaxID=433724 RepID=S0DF21_9ZZZZ